MGTSVLLSRKRTKRAVCSSKKRAEQQRAVEDKFNAGETVEGEVITEALRAPDSDIPVASCLHPLLTPVASRICGTRIEARVIEMDRNRNNVVLLAVLFLRRLVRQSVRTSRKPRPV